MNESMYFRAMLERDWKETQNIKEGIPIAIPNIDSDILRTILRFIECGEIVFPKIERDFFSIYLELVYHSNYLGIPDMEDCLSSLAGKFLTIDTLRLSWTEAVICGCTGLARECERFASTNFDRVSAHDEWLRLPREFIRNILMRGDIKCKNQFIVDALFMWGRLCIQFSVFRCFAGWVRRALINHAHSLLFRYNLYKEGTFPKLEVLQAYVVDLLPPHTLFSQDNKMFLLTY
eukprot:TRINITY_DN5074_c0_g2_i6.p1 TRINITY_DN5074_c0_g2~~TRINITY_DN5074_c0_g2_i6.p1  ORF type:complete len:233 (+),score=22.57 TRINITY_DN5074_c0_g2_i6:214-912(+)